MRSPYSVKSSMEFGTGVVVAITLILSVGIVGCNSPAATHKVATATVSNNTNSHGLIKLTASQIDEKIKAVQANTSIPESAKPKIIEGIRAQGEP